MKNDQVVTVYVSQGKETRFATVPSVEGASAANAAAALSARKLTSKTKEEYSSSVAEGYVISQNPAAGTEVLEGSEVTIVVSKGKQTITLVSLVGETEQNAAATLDRMNLKVQTIREYNNYVPAGQVIRQSPDSNTEVMPGSLVTLYVSLGPTPPPVETDPVETEPSSETTEPSDAPAPVNEETP